MLKNKLRHPLVAWETLKKEFKETGNLSRYRYLKEQSSSESQRRKPKSPNIHNPGFLSRSELADRLRVTIGFLDIVNRDGFGYRFGIWTQFLDPEGREWFCQGDLCHCSEAAMKDENGRFIYKMSKLHEQQN